MIIPFFHNWSYSSFLHSMGCALLEYHSSTHACNIGKYIFIQLAFNNWWWVENEMEINGKVKWIKRQYSWLIFTFHLGSELWINNWLHICTNIAWLLCCSSSKMNSADGCTKTKIWKKIFGLLIICWKDYVELIYNDLVMKSFSSSVHVFVSFSCVRVYFISLRKFGSRPTVNI